MPSQKQIEHKTLIQIETHFWSSLFNQTLLYGADVPGTLFKQKSNYPWDLTKLESVLKDGLGKTKLNGITEPYLYIGGYGTIFGWHVEDMNMASINFNHSGAPKVWYCIGRKDSKKFEGFVKEKFPQEFLECSEFLRHKTTIINPYFLREQLPGLSLSKICQEAGQFVITLNSGYHSGFNLGFNIAESVNFATPDWLPNFPKYKVCRCHSGSAFLDPFQFHENLSKIKSYRENPHFQ